MAELAGTDVKRSVGPRVGSLDGASVEGDEEGGAETTAGLRHRTRSRVVWSRVISSTLGLPVMPCCVRMTRLPLKTVRPWTRTRSISQLSSVVSAKESLSRSGMAGVV